MRIHKPVSVPLSLGLNANEIVSRLYKLNMLRINGEISELLSMYKCLELRIYLKCCTCVNVMVLGIYKLLRKSSQRMYSRPVVVNVYIVPVFLDREPTAGWVPKRISPSRDEVTRWPPG